MTYEKNLCDFCGSNDNVGVFGAYSGPFSISYCDTCQKQIHLVSKFYSINKFARFGEVCFIDRIDKKPLTVFHEGKYISLKEYIDNIDEEEVDKFCSKRQGIKEMIKNRLEKQFKKQLAKKRLKNI